VQAWVDEVLVLNTKKVKKTSSYQHGKKHWLYLMCLQLIDANRFSTGCANILSKCDLFWPAALVSSNPWTYRLMAISKLQ
jgi:hypothetical protein